MSKARSVRASGKEQQRGIPRLRVNSCRVDSLMLGCADDSLCGGVPSLPGHVAAETSILPITRLILP